MKTTDFCEELDDLVRIDLIPMEGTSIPVPFAVTHIAQLKGGYPNASPLPSGAINFAASLLTLTLADNDAADALMADKSKLEATHGRESAGEVFTHTLKCPVYRGFQAISERLASIAGRDFLIVATCYDGRQYLSYSLPNTSVLSWKQAKSPGSEGTVTATVKAMSSFVLLTA